MQSALSLRCSASGLISRLGQLRVLRLSSSPKRGFHWRCSNFGRTRSLAALFEQLPKRHTEKLKRSKTVSMFTNFFVVALN